MKRLRLTIVSAAVLASSVLFTGNGSGRFDTKLSKDQQILQALNRLTFGARPGDIAEVRSMGVDKWIDLQLHPDRIPENPALEAKLKPLETLRMAPSEVLKEYVQRPFRTAQVMRITDVLPQDEFRRVNTGTIEEREAVLKSLDPDKRQKVLAMLNPQTFPCAPDLQKEIEAARKAQTEARQKEFRQRMPPLRELLDKDEVNVAMYGAPDEILALLGNLDPLKRQQVAAALPQKALAELPEVRREGMRLRQPQQVMTEDLKQGKVFRALYTNRQLEEVLVDFWFNHFNIYEAKQNDRPLVASFERDAIRPHVLGHFKDLLLATARHPAMLYYLDNWESMSPDVFDIGPFAGPAQQVVQQVQRQARGLNENYGRELMELHTLGVNGGYTQQDVIAVARAFSGWTVRKPSTEPEFVFAAFMHDTGEKVVLGHKLPNNGEQDGLQVIDILAHHPSTAKFISRKLAQRFVADDPPQALVDRMAATFTKTDGDLRAVLQTMFASTEFFSEGAWQAKLKSPLEMVVSSVRAMGGEATDAFTLAQKIADLGEPLYSKLEPTGYPNTGEAWLNTAGLLGRMSFAQALASGQIAGVKLNGPDLDGKDAAAIARELLGRDPSTQTLEAMEKGMEGREPSPKILTGLVISSPDFQRR